MTNTTRPEAKSSLKKSQSLKLVIGDKVKGILAKAAMAEDGKDGRPSTSEAVQQVVDAALVVVTPDQVVDASHSSNVMPDDPEDANYPKFAVDTKQLFSDLLQTPLKAKHFAKPPIRFLYDLLRQVSFQIDSSAESKFFLSYVFDDPSLASAPKEISAKMKFLQLVIDGVQHKCRECGTACPPIDSSNVARGHEPQQTCVFLTKIYDLAMHPEKFRSPVEKVPTQEELIGQQTASTAVSAAVQSQKRQEEETNRPEELEAQQLPAAPVADDVKESEAAIKYQEMLKKLEGKLEGQDSEKESALPSVENTDQSADSKSKDSSKTDDAGSKPGEGTVLAPVKDRLEKELERIEDMMNEVDEELDPGYAERKRQEHLAPSEEFEKKYILLAARKHSLIFPE
jgi:hypothetical protein